MTSKSIEDAAADFLDAEAGLSEGYLELLASAAQLVKDFGVADEGAQHGADVILEGMKTGELAEYVDELRERAIEHAPDSHQAHAGVTSAQQAQPGLRLVASNGQLLPS